MLRFNPMLQLTLVKVRDFWREPEAMFWVFAFPILLALALGIAFRSSAPEEIPVGVEAGAGAEWIVDALDDDPGLRPTLLQPDESRRRLRTGKVAIVVRPGDPWTYWLDPTRPESRLARLAVNDALQRAAGREEMHEATDLAMTEKGSRYIDFLIPGLLGMNLMGTGMWGVGFSIVHARSKKLLRRLVATPMSRSQFLLAQMSGRLVFLVLEVGALVGFAALVFGVPLRGSWFALAIVCLVGGLTFCGLGLLVAARPRTIEGVSGLMNLVMMPMWICSGTFFSTSRFPDAVQPVVQALPLTALNDALRAVMLEGATLAQVGPDLLVAVLWGAVSFVAALWMFRWS